MQDRMQELEFLNPVFRDGVNVTVRNGDKWRSRVDIGDRVIAKIGGRTLEVVIVGVLYENFHNIPAPVHRMNHDPDCRSVSGIKGELERIYGPYPNGIIGDVTVLFFRFADGSY